MGSPIWFNSATEVVGPMPEGCDLHEQRSDQRGARTPSTCDAGVLNLTHGHGIGSSPRRERSQSSMSRLAISQSVSHELLSVGLVTHRSSRSRRQPRAPLASCSQLLACHPDIPTSWWQRPHQTRRSGRQVVLLAPAARVRSRATGQGTPRTTGSAGRVRNT